MPGGAGGVKHVHKFKANYNLRKKNHYNYMDAKV